MRKQINFLTGRFAIAILSAFMGITGVNAQSSVTTDTYHGETEITATGSITFEPGFEVPAGYSFRAYITDNAGGCAILSSSPSSNRNYVLTNVMKAPGITSVSGKTNCQVNQTVQYFDGLGRALQTVQVQASPTGKDIILPIAYDGLGRETKKYLPYASDSTVNGIFRSNAILTKQAAFYNSGTGWDAYSVKTDHPYAETVLEASPLNRVLEQGAPGDVWQPYSGSISGSGHTVKMEYATNTSSGDLAAKLFTATAVTTTGQEYKRTLATSASYGAGELMVTITKDENWVSGKAGTTEEYKDKDGRVVLKRAWRDESVRLSTYYVYDDLGNLSYVIPPGANPDSATVSQAALDNYCYQYRYDDRARLIEKKVPGKGWEEMVYNKLDQVVMTRDSVHKDNGKWLFTKYDVLARPVITGIISSSSSRITWQASIDGQGTLWEARDNSNASGTGTGYTNATLPTSSVDRYHTVTYYDDYNFYNNSYGGAGTGENANVRGLATGSLTNILGSSTMLLATNYYDEEGRVIRSKSQNHLSGTDIVTNTYTFTGELLSTARAHTSSTASVSAATRYEYDAWGRKRNTYEAIEGQTEVKLAGMDYNETGRLRKKALHDRMDSTAYVYNERAWLTELHGPHFLENLHYNLTAHDGFLPATAAQFNGNISEQEYQTAAAGGQYFVYTYDKLNRLTGGYNSPGNNETGITYDMMGNLRTLNRYQTSTLIDQLTYTYENSGGSNRLATLNDATASSIGAPAGTSSYAYDGNGNATTDGRTGRTVTYNLLNLPATVNISGGLTYTYTATGEKLTKVSNGTTTQYAGGIQYTGTSIDFIQTEEGIARNNSGTYSYEYNLKDHLGNSRVTIYKNPSTGNIEAKQSDDYYPFGMRISTVSGTNKYLYNGKEEQDDWGGVVDYGARFYDPVIGRWNSVDPLAEKYKSFSPYVYGANNPVRFIDVDGREIVDPKGNRITFNLNKNGGLDWSKNATPDVMRIGNAMAKTEIGLQALSKLDQANFDVTMSINNSDLITEANGAIRSGFSTPTLDSKGNISKYDVTVYEKGIDATSTSKEGSRPVVMKDGEKVYMDKYTKDEHIGAVGVHESRHVTDKDSRGFQNKGKDVEKGPNSDQLKHYRELDDKKQ